MPKQDLDIRGMGKTAQAARREVIDMVHAAGSGHLGGSLSSAEILTVLYDAYLRIDPARPAWEDRDRFVLSKGHAAPLLYATLARKGFFPEAALSTLRRFGSPLQGHPCMFKASGVDMSAGSLGLGLSVAVGMALSARLMQKDYRIFVLCGDGELQEGQNWEAFMALSKWNLTRVITIIDRNTVQLDGTNEEVMPLGDVTAKLKAFGMEPIECDGHDIASLVQAMDAALLAKKPPVLVANTVKGKGVSFMEGKSEWHGKPLTEETYRQAIDEIQRGLAAWK